jgi:hypothetical protein
MLARINPGPVLPTYPNPKLVPKNLHKTNMAKGGNLEIHFAGLRESWIRFPAGGHYLPADKNNESRVNPETLAGYPADIAAMELGGMVLEEAGP